VNNRLQSTLSLCQRAGKLRLGFDQVKDAAAAGELSAVFVATDLSEKTKKEVLFFCKQYGLSLWQLPLCKEEIHIAVKKASGVLGVAEAGFAKNLSQQGEALQ